MQGSDCFILANDSDQAGDDLSLAKKLIAYNPELAAEIEVRTNELRLKDGSASLRILPANDALGAHGKSAAFVGFDEIHGYRSWDILEAMQLDPHRRDAVMWITSYASIYSTSGAPLHDLMQIGKAGTDRRMLFSWYSADYCTDPACADLAPEAKANPSLAASPDLLAYIEQQRMRLPIGRFRRLHLNLPGAPQGAAFDQSKILACVVTGRRSIPYQEGRHYVAAVDMSGGSNDDACLAIAHAEGKIAVLDLVVKQIGPAPFNARNAVSQFCGILDSYKISKVYGDAYGGLTFRQDFEACYKQYDVRTTSASELYEQIEPVLNANEVELLDAPTLIDQLVCLVWRGSKITHENGAHDDHANAAALAINLVREKPPQVITQELLSRAFMLPRSRAFGSARRMPVFYPAAERQCMPQSSLPPEKRGA